MRSRLRFQTNFIFNLQWYPVPGTTVETSSWWQPLCTAVIRLWPVAVGPWWLAVPPSVSNHKDFLSARLLFGGEVSSEAAQCPALPEASCLDHTLPSNAVSLACVICNFLWQLGQWCSGELLSTDCCFRTTSCWQIILFALSKSKSSSVRSRLNNAMSLILMARRSRIRVSFMSANSQSSAARQYSEVMYCSAISSSLCDLWFSCAPS